ncbi:MAG: hypothetical protein KF777_00995 [Planctomycetaceae bacterium]|nr:hypothetical protein [Planctomycetaceae bacterium]
MAFDKTTVKQAARGQRAEEPHEATSAVPIDNPHVARIADALRVLIEPGSVFEILALGCRTSDNRRSHQRGGFFDFDHIDDAAKEAHRLSQKGTGDDQGNAEAVYFTLNPLNPDLLARRMNRVGFMKQGEAASDPDVIKRRWLLIDCDPKRLSGISSTEKEKQDSRSTASAIKAELSAAGWPDPIFADSGNGSHLLYRIDLPPKDGDIVKNCLRALAVRHDSGNVTVDQKVFNPARICKLYGTYSRKGDSTTERPHRMAGMGQPKSPLEIVPRERLERLAATAPADAAMAAQQPVDEWIIDRARKYIAKIPGSESGKGGSDPAYKVACELIRGFNLPRDIARKLFDEWNLTCKPPWRDAEINHKLDDAEKKATGEPGYRLKREKRTTGGGIKDGRSGENDDDRIEPGAFNSHDLPPLTEGDDVPFEVPSGVSTEGEAGAIADERFPAESGVVHQTAPKRLLDTPKTALEADDDPDRLARDCLQQKFLYRDGLLTLRRWRKEWWQWSPEDRCYIEIKEDQFGGLVGNCMKNEFDRLAVDALANADPDKPPPKTLKVTIPLRNSVISRIDARTIINEEIEPPCWVKESPQAKQNRDPRDFVSVRNGILDVREYLAGRPCLVDHSPYWFSVSALPFAYDPTAQSAEWNHFLATSFKNDDERRMLRQWFGYCLTHDTSQQKFLMLEGDGGNGKSVVCAALEAVLGEQNVSHVGIDAFDRGFGLYVTMGKLANIASEFGELGKARESKLKEFTGGNSMTFDRKNKDPVNATPTARLTFSVNNRPPIDDKSDGIWRRLLLLPMTVKIQDADKIKRMDTVDFWYGSRGSALLNWSLQGLADLRANGFVESAASVDAKAEYRKDTNPLDEFLEDHFEATGHADDFVWLEEALEVCHKWHIANGYKRNELPDKTALGKALNKRWKPLINKRKLGSRSNRVSKYEGLKWILSFEVPGGF